MIPPTRLEELKRLAEHLPDCGDNSCRFSSKRGGMRTNGGCRCLGTRSTISWTPIERYAAVARMAVPELIAEVERLRGALEKIAKPASIETSGAEDIDEMAELFLFWHMKSAEKLNIAQEALKESP